MGIGRKKISMEYYDWQRKVTPQMKKYITSPESGTRSQGSEVRGQKSEVRGQESGVRDQESGIRMRERAKISEDCLRNGLLLHFCSLFIKKLSEGSVCHAT